MKPFIKQVFFKNGTKITREDAGETSQGNSFCLDKGLGALELRALESFYSPVPLLINSLNAEYSFLFYLKKLSSNLHSDNVTMTKRHDNCTLINDLQCLTFNYPLSKIMEAAVHRLYKISNLKLTVQSLILLSSIIKPLNNEKSKTDG